MRCGRVRLRSHPPRHAVWPSSPAQPPTQADDEAATVPQLSPPLQLAANRDCVTKSHDIQHYALTRLCFTLRTTVRARSRNYWTPRCTPAWWESHSRRLSSLCSAPLDFLPSHRHTRVASHLVDGSLLASLAIWSHQIDTLARTSKRVAHNHPHKPMRSTKQACGSQPPSQTFRLEQHANSTDRAWLLVTPADGGQPRYVFAKVQASERCAAHNDPRITNASSLECQRGVWLTATLTQRGVWLTATPTHATASTAT